MEALLNSRVWTTGLPVQSKAANEQLRCYQMLPGLLGFRGVLGWAFYLLGAFVTGILEWCLIDGPIVAVPLPEPQLICSCLNPKSAYFIHIYIYTYNKTFVHTNTHIH